MVPPPGFGLSKLLNDTRLLCSSPSCTKLNQPNSINNRNANRTARASIQSIQRDDLNGQRREAEPALWQAGSQRTKNNWQDKDNPPPRCLSLVRSLILLRFHRAGPHTPCAALVDPHHPC